jgi:hypothetical protein
MRILTGIFILSLLLPVASRSALCQTDATQSAKATEQTSPAMQASPAASPNAQDFAASPSAITPATEALIAFKDSEVKFSVEKLMDILADKRHEGWVLAAYPDPKTSHPLIGAGFSLDLAAREHPQLDPKNPHPFYEPSSAELWQAAGLEPARLTNILAQFHEQLTEQTAHEMRRNLGELAAQIDESDARLLVRIGIVQSILNARAYCRNFDQLTASQQMALTQLVYQIGFNLQEFTEFLALINNDELPVRNATAGGAEKSLLRQATARTSPATAYWQSVQKSLTQSQWARLYRARAIAVIAMFDPRYVASPTAAERRVSAVLRPLRRGRSRARASTVLVAGHATGQRGQGAGHGKRARKSRKRAA